MGIGRELQGQNGKVILGTSHLTDNERDFITGTIPQSGWFLEVGTADGASAAYWADLRPEVNFLCVDWLSHRIHVQAPANWLANRRGRGNMFLLVGETSQVLPVVRNRLCDIALVDASHRYTGCIAELNQVDHIMKDTGLVLVHDYKSPKYVGVTQAVDEFCAKRAWVVDECVDWTIRLRRKRHGSVSP